MPGDYQLWSKDPPTRALPAAAEAVAAAEEGSYVATLRRELVENSLMAREDGRYWRV